MIWKLLFGGGKSKEPGPPPRDVKELLMGRQKAALHLVTTVPRGTSFLNGAPSIAPDRWPEHKGKKLGFLAQIDLAHAQAQLPMDWLPKSGALLFFYDMENGPWGFDPADRGSWAVIHQPATSQELAPGSPPPSDSGYSRAFVTFRTILSYPSWERVPELDLTREEIDALTDLSSDQFGEQPDHQIGGLPRPVQDDCMERECQLASNGIYCGDQKHLKDPRVPELEKGAGEWRLLLQLDSDDSAGFGWGDGGMLYFFVKDSDARAGDFSNVWMVLQCF
jgi:uncharacterized protein YwqG